MNRTQKKCVLATAGIHLLLLVILFVGPAFFNPKPNFDNSQVLDVIPANLVDAQFNSGVKNAQQPAPAPVAVPQPPPPAPKPAVQPAPAPSPSFVEKVEKMFKSEPAKPAPDLTRAEKPEKRAEKNSSHKIQINTQLVTRTASKTSSAKNSEAVALRNAIQHLQKNFSPSTTIDLSGNSSAAYANYASVVKSIYEQAWQPPDDTASDDANTKVSVTIASDGTVISARIIAPSDDAGVNATVQRTLDRINFIAPFPKGAKEKQRTYIINFNLKAKRMLG